MMEGDDHVAPARARGGQPLTWVKCAPRRRGHDAAMNRALLLAAVVLGGCAAATPDFSTLVRQEAAAVVKVGAFGAGAPEEPLAPGEGEDEPADLAEVFERLLGGGVVAAPNLGSGFLVSADGYIVTNAHLVEGADADGIVVRLADRRDFKARLVGADPVSDIALLKIDAGRLPKVTLGNARELHPGQWVAAIGSPLGLDQSVTAGIVSAIGRTLPEESYLPFIQTDVPINPGNSGGPLFNLRGEVVGVNTVIYSATGGFMGLSFAVPIDIAMDVVRELKANGRMTRGRIGVRLQDLSPELARALRVPADAGATVVDVMRSGPAERAGLRAGDVVLAFGGKPVRSHVELMRLVAAARPGEEVETLYARDGRLETLRLSIEEAHPPFAPRVPLAADADPLGLLVVPLERRRRERLGLDAGVMVLRAEGPAQRAGLEPGDIIVSVNTAPVATPYAFHQRMRAAGRGASVALLVQRGGVRSFAVLRVPD